MQSTNAQRATDDFADLNDGRMSFLDHLDELRTRLIRSCVALAAGMALSWFFIDRIADAVLTALLTALPAGSALITTKPGEGFAFYLDLALMGGVVVAAPFITYQVWRFVAPGLYSNEKRLLAPFLLFACAGSIAGAWFSHRLLFPSMMAFFASFDSAAMRFTPRVEDTFALYKNTLIGMVGVFQIPTLVFVLARLRAVTARWLLRHLNYAVLAAVTVAAVLTPSPDPWNQIIFAAPMLAMYLIGIVVAWVFSPPDRSRGEDSASVLHLVFAAGVLEQAQRNSRSVQRPRLVHTRTRFRGRG